MHFSKLSKEQGFVYVPILIAAIALIGFIFVSSSADFKSNLFARLFPNKPKSHASEVSKIELIGNLGVGVTSQTQTYTNNIQAKLTYIPPVPSPTPFATASASVSSCPAGFYWNGDSCQQTTNPIPASSVPSSITPSPVPSVTPSQAANPVITNITPVSGSIGTEITITGTNFGLVPGQLAFCCAQPGADVIWSDTQIKAKVPRYARTGVLTVIVGTGLNQKFARSQAPFTVIQTTTTPALTTTPEIGSTAPIGVGGSVQGVAYTQTPILPSEYKVAVGNSQNEAQSAFNSAPSVPFNISEWQAPANNQSGYTKVISLQLPGGFGQKYAALQFMINGVWQQVLISAPINFVQAPTPSATPSTGDWKTYTIPLTKADTNNNPTGSLIMQIQKGVVTNDFGKTQVRYKFKFNSLSIQDEKPNTAFYPIFCGKPSGNNDVTCVHLSELTSGGVTGAAGNMNMTLRDPGNQLSYTISVDPGQNLAYVGVFTTDQQSSCGFNSIDRCTLKGTIDLSQLTPVTSPTPTPSPATLTLNTPDPIIAGSTISFSWSGLTSPKVDDVVFVQQVGGSLNRGIMYINSCGPNPGKTAKASGTCTNFKLSTSNVSGNFQLELYNNSKKVAASKTFSLSATGSQFSADALCKADVNGDGFINVRDFSSLTVCVGEKVKTEVRAKYACKYADLNGDGQVNEKDVNDVIKPNFGKTVDRKVCKNWTLWQALRVDVNGDGGVSSVDAFFVKRYVANLDKILGRNIGDVNNDGKITHDDAELALKIGSNLNDPKTNKPFTADQKKRADVDRNGSVTSIDSLKIDRFAQGTDKVLADIGDIDMDGKLTNTDADLILRFAGNLPPQ